MSQKKLVSVVIPTFNRVNVIERAVNSVLNQTYKNWELLIVDDGSTDGTQILIEDKYGADDRVKFMKRPASRKKGANACRNIGIEHARGDYIAFLDSDDKWTEDHLLRKLNYLISSEADAVFSGFYYHKHNRMIPIKIKEYRACKEIGNYIYVKKQTTSTPTIVCKSVPCLSIKFDEELQKHQERDFVIRFDQLYNIITEPTLTVHVFTDSNNRISSSMDHEATENLLKRNKNKLSPQALKKYYFSLTLNTLFLEGKTEFYYKYRDQVLSLTKNKYRRSLLTLIDIPYVGISIIICRKIYFKVKFFVKSSSVNF